MLFIRLFLKSFRFAYNSLVVNQLRTFLLGITIGIFCIISVFLYESSILLKGRFETAWENWAAMWFMFRNGFGPASWRDGLSLVGNT